MKPLVIIPARGGSKGIPHKNIRLLGGKPLICRAIDNARAVADDSDICVSTDDPEIIRVAEDYGLKVPFVRPAELAADNSGTYEVLLHALDFYERQGRHYDAIVLLQPTSPFRRDEDVRGAMALYTPDIDMVVSITEATVEPVLQLFRNRQQRFSADIERRRQLCAPTRCAEGMGIQRGCICYQPGVPEARKPRQIQTSKGL